MMDRIKFCKCGHREVDHHLTGDCYIRGCLCEQYRTGTNYTKTGVAPVTKYCQGPPPPDYTPSREPEPLRW